MQIGFEPGFSFVPYMPTSMMSLSSGQLFRIPFCRVTEMIYIRISDTGFQYCSEPRKLMYSYPF